MPLAQGQILNNRYRIVKRLGEGGNQVCQEESRGIVVFFKRKPGCISIQTAQPIADQSGLAIPGGRGDKRERSSQASIQSLNQPWAKDKVVTSWRRIEFGGEQGYSSNYT